MSAALALAVAPWTSSAQQGGAARVEELPTQMQPPTGMGTIYGEPPPAVGAPAAAVIPTQPTTVEALEAVPGLRDIRELPPFGAQTTPAPAPVALFGSDALSSVREVEMYVGEGRTFDAPGVARIAVGTGSVITATVVDDRQVLVFANSVGVSSLTAWDRRGRQATVRVTVVPSDTQRTLQEIATFVQSIPNASARVLGDKVVIDGQDLSDADQQKLALLAQRYASIINFASRVGWERMIQLDTIVLEIPTSKSSSLGVEWDAQTQGGFYAGVAGDAANDSINERPGDSPISLPFPTGGINATAGINALLTSRINAIVRKGDGVVLANPRLTTRSGSAADFLSGGEIPYLTASATGTPSVVFKQYGVKLSITPVADTRTHTIRSVIDTEVSDIDPSLSTSAGPALLTRRTRAEFNVRELQTMVLSGFRQRRQNRQVNQVPGLGSIPVIGSLFRSRSLSDTDTSLVIFVTPRLVEAGSEAMDSEIGRAQREMQRLDAPDQPLPPPLPRRSGPPR